MAHKTNSFERFWKELKRRKVVHVITVYAAVSFVILQLVDIVAEPLRLPESTKALVIVLLCIGFIIAVFVSWVYDITPSGVKKTKPVSELKYVDHSTREVSGGWKIATYVSAVIIVAFLAFNIINRRNLNTDISKLEKSIAVLPFRNDSSSDSTMYFINGLMEKILNNLQMIKELRVISRTSVEQYRNTKKTIPEIAKEQDVNYIVEGSGQKYGNTFSINVQLIKAAKENHLWGKSFEKEIKEIRDITSVQSEIAQSIAEELKTRITPEEKQLIEKVPTVNLTAYDFYQRGKEEEGKYPYYTLASATTVLDYNLPSPLDKQKLEIAEKLYQKALKCDSTLALAYSGLASIYWGRNYYKEYFSQNFLDSVLLLSDKALSFDDDLPDAHFIRGMYFKEKGNYKQALEEFDKTIKLNPNYWLAYLGKGSLYCYECENVLALENLQKAISLHHGAGLSEVFKNIANTLWASGFGELANKYFINAAKIEPDSATYYSWLNQADQWSNNEYLKKGYRKDSTNSAIIYGLAYSYLQTNQFNESLKFFKKYLEILKENQAITINNMQRIGFAYLKTGYRDSADYFFNKQIEYCNEAIKLGRPYGLSYAYYDLGGVYAIKGDKEKAYKNLKIFSNWNKRDCNITDYINGDPLFNSIRNEPEFLDILKEMQSNCQAEHEKVRKWLKEQGML
jgi:TolB-like protein/Tfp pilus assembly protein PilF